ncbi:MAG: PKD domain-containing protein [Desulfobacteraceae bacterium]|nr:PKD domain-containing protein [Desulfobacteraceae bacterium]
MNGDGAPQIANSTLRYNNRGIEVYNRHGIPQPVVNRCSFYENSESNYYVAAWGSWNTTTLDATNNWWGTDDPQLIAETIWDYNDSNSAALVNFEGWVNVFTDFTAQPKTGKAPLTVQFTDRSVGSPTSWQWDFDNDGIIDSTEQNPTYTYNTIGLYSVKLIAGNADATDEELKTDYINVFDLKADFTANPTSGTLPLIVQFTDKTAGGPASWEWDFDNDGIIDSTEQNPTHTYDKDGSYSVKLTVSNTDATDEELKTDYIKVIPPTVLTADFIADQTTGNAQLEVKFTDKSTGSPASWQWDFDNDGTIDSTEQNPTYTYNTAGVYSVKLIVSDETATDEELKENYIQVSDSDLLADLQVTDVQISDKAYAGQPFQVNWTGKNSGSSATTESDWTDRVYLSPEPVFNEQTAQISGDLQNKTSLQPGETYTGTATFTLPDDKTETYYVFVFADILNNQPEKDENNNSGVSSAFEIESSPSSNLAAREIKAPLSAFLQTELEISWMVQNTGEWNISGQWADRIYLSSDKALNSDDLLLGEFSRAEGMIGMI